MENRAAAHAPDVPQTFAALMEFPAAFQAYYGDNYGFRETLLALDALVKLRVFGASPAKDVIVGKAGWLYFNADHALELALGRRRLSSEEVECWIRALEARERWLAERHIAYVFAFAPNKEEIYPEHVPSRLERLAPSPIDDLAALARAHGTTCFLDLRPSLLSEKALAERGDPVYHPGDTHWTSRGAWAACNALLDHLHASVPSFGRAIAARSDRVERRIPCEAGDLDRQVGRPSSLASMPCFEPRNPRARQVLYREFPRQEWRFAIDDPSLPRVLLLHDSFGPGLQPYLAEHCSELVCRWDYTLAQSVIDKMHPDVVIQIYTERGVALPPVPMTTPVLRKTPEECSAIAKTIIVDDLESAPAALVARGSTTLTALAPGAHAGIAVETTSAADTIATPPVALQAGSHPILRIDITAPRPTDLSVFYGTRADPRYQRARTCLVALDAGRNDVCVELLVDDVEGPLLVRPGLEPGRYELHRLEIGATPPETERRASARIR